MRLLLAFFCLGALACGGCQKRTTADDMLPFEKLPADVSKVAVQTLPDVKFESARKFRSGGEDAFEIRGKNKQGKIREVELSASGKILEVE